MVRDIATGSSCLTTGVNANELQQLFCATAHIIYIGPETETPGVRSRPPAELLNKTAAIYEGKKIDCATNSFQCKF